MRSLWSLLGGEQGRRVPCYDTNCGWLGYTLEELLDNVSRSIDQGFRGVKVKIGVDFEEDLRRLSAVRARLGDDSSPPMPTTAGICRRPCGGHHRWSSSTSPGWRSLCIPSTFAATPNWLQRSRPRCCTVKKLYEPLMIRDMLEADALGLVQPSDMKLGGISRWMDVAEIARIDHRRVVPAGWTMLQIDQHLAAATPHYWMVESIPWIREIFQEPARLEDGYVVPSDTPGANTAIKPEFIAQYAI